MILAECLSLGISLDVRQGCTHLKARLVPGDLLPKWRTHMAVGGRPQSPQDALSILTTWQLTSSRASAVEEGKEVAAMSTLKESRIKYLSKGEIPKNL